MHAGYRSILMLTSLANTRGGQSERHVSPAPIRTPEWSSRLSGNRRIPFTQTHNTPEQKAVFSLIHFPVYLSLAIVLFFLGEGDRNLAPGYYRLLVGILTPEAVVSVSG